MAKKATAKTTPAAPVSPAAEFRAKTPDQLRDNLIALKKEAFNLRFQQATGQLENTARMRAVRRDVARIKTVLTQKAADAAAAN